MALKSGSSHAMATLIMTISGAILIQYLKEVLFFESLFWLIRSVSDYIQFWISMLLNVIIPVEYLDFITLAGLLSFLWGVSYHYIRHGN